MTGAKNPAPAGTGSGATQNRQANHNPSALSPNPGFPAWGGWTMGSVIEQFRVAMQTDGLDPPDLEPGRFHRFPGLGKRRGNTAGWCKLFADGRGGVYGDFSTSLLRTWTLGGGRFQLDEATRREIEAVRKARQAEIEARHRKRAAEARVRWGRAKPCTDHPYLTRKGVQAYGLRLGDWPKWLETPDGWRRVIIPGALLVPMRDEAGTLWNLQAVFPEPHPDLGRDKDFMSGRKAGLFFAIGEPTDTLMICEGFATAATVHETTGNRVYVAFDRTNLKAVALIVRKLHPKSRIIIAGDNDRFTPGNPGLTDARAAALAVGGLISIPEFPEGVQGTDWNDWHQWRANHGDA